MERPENTKNNIPRNALLRRDDLRAELLNPLPKLNDAIQYAAVHEPTKLLILQNAKHELLSQANSFDRLREPKLDPVKQQLVRSLSEMNNAIIIALSENPEQLPFLSEERRRIVTEIFKFNKDLDLQRQERFTNHFSVGVFTTGTVMTVGAVGLIATGLVAPLVASTFLTGGFFIAGAGIYNLAKPYVEKNIKYVLGPKIEKAEENKQPSESSEIKV